MKKLSNKLFSNKNKLPPTPSPFDKLRAGSEKRGSLLVVGSVAYDSIYTPFGKAERALGGSATYFSLASSIFTPTSIVAVIGDDFKDEEIFKKRNINIKNLVKIPGKTFHWAGKYHFDMNTRDTLKTELGVFTNFKPKLNDKQKNAEYIFLGNIHPKIQMDVLNQIKSPKIIGLDTMNFWIETAYKALTKVLKRIDILVINESEARELSKEKNLLKASRKILKMMGGQKQDTLIIKQGEYGLVTFHQNKIFNLPGFLLENVVDPTGAGDSFAGGFMGYLAKNENFSWKNLKKACVAGSCLASFTVEDFGVKKLANLKKEDLNKRTKLYSGTF